MVAVHVGKQHKVNGTEPWIGLRAYNSLNRFTPTEVQANLSSALFGRQGDLIGDPADASKKLRLLWLSCGDKDGLMTASKAFQDSLDDKKVAHVWHIDSGAHEWPVWKNDLYLMSQMLFQKEK